MHAPAEVYVEDGRRGAPAFVPSGMSTGEEIELCVDHRADATNPPGSKTRYSARYMGVRDGNLKLTAVLLDGRSLGAADFTIPLTAVTGVRERSSYWLTGLIAGLVVDAIAAAIIVNRFNCGGCGG